MLAPMPLLQSSTSWVRHVATKMPPLWGFRPTRQRLGVRQCSAAFSPAATMRKRQRTGAVQNLAAVEQAASGRWERRALLGNDYLVKAVQISRKLFAKVAGILCSIFVIGIVTVGVYDLFSPWSVASEALQRYGKHCRFCVGVGYESYTTDGEGRVTSTSSRHRAFFVMRSPRTWPRLVTVSQDHVGQVAVQESLFRFWLVVSVGMTWGAWHFGLRPFLQMRNTGELSQQTKPRVATTAVCSWQPSSPHHSSLTISP